MNITKEALIERGFTLINTGPNGETFESEKHISCLTIVVFLFKAGAISVYVVESVDETFPFETCVPNCQTMDQIDQLINLFIKT